jgi:hypothetical protein
MGSPLKKGEIKRGFRNPYYHACHRNYKYLWLGFSMSSELPPSPLFGKEGGEKEPRPRNRKRRGS